MNNLVGYADPLTVTAGQTVACLASCDAGTLVSGELVRIIGREETDSGGQARVEAVEFAEPWTWNGRPQGSHAGSFAVIPQGQGHINGSFRYRVNVLVTIDFSQQSRLPWLYGYRPGRVQTLMSSLGDDGRSGLALVLDEQLRPALLLGTPDGPREAVTVGTGLRPETWYAVEGGYDAVRGEVFVSSVRLDLAYRSGAVQHGRDKADAPVSDPAASFAIAAQVHRGGGPGGWIPSSPFTGRLEDPEIVEDVDGQDRVIASWDFARGIESYDIEDVSGGGRAGQLHNLPMRAVCGSRWDGRTTAWREAPDQYAAIHFFADAIEDAAWEAAATVELPSDLPSGYYAFRLTTEDDADLVPFFVRRAMETAPARILFLAPIATYLAYANSRFWWEGFGEELWQNRVVELGPREQMLLDRPELGLSCYDQHQDGTDVAYVSSRHPDLFMRPGFAYAQGYDTDLEIIGWLKHLGHDFDVVTDVDLDREGVALIADYDVIITGSHPEYISDPMRDALASYLDNGGRLLGLGGNNYFWTVAFNRDRPWIMEIRKPETAVGSRISLPAEKHLAFTGQLGGACRPAEPLMGVGAASMGWEYGGARPYELLDAAQNPRVAFAFDGVLSTTIGDHGRPGGAVVFQEWDRSDPNEGTPSHALVVARSAPPSAIQRRFGAVKAPNHAEIVFFETPGGGAVFTVATMAWCCALPDEEYENDISRVSANVLHRFLNRKPFDYPST